MSGRTLLLGATLAVSLGCAATEKEPTDQTPPAAVRTTSTTENIRALREQVLAERERTLPADNPDIQLARIELAQSLADAGEFAGAPPAETRRCFADLADEDARRGVKPRRTYVSGY